MQVVMTAQCDKLQYEYLQCVQDIIAFAFKLYTLPIYSLLSSLTSRQSREWPNSE